MFKFGERTDISVILSPITIPNIFGENSRDSTEKILQRSLPNDVITNEG